jgi:transcriptional regulator with XRE-family HTH domain
MRRSRIKSAAIAETIRAFRELRDLSQERLAAKAGVARTYVGRVERAATNPTLLTVFSMLEGMNVTWREFGQELDTIFARITMEKIMHSKKGQARLRKQPP